MLHRRVPPVLVALLCGTFLAGAAKAPAKKSVFGKYEGRWGEFTLEERPGGKAHLDFIIGVPGCTGAIEGEGVLEGQTFTLVAPVEDQEDPCRLTITFGKKATVETEGCTYFHGASCEFEGDYRRASKRRK